MCISYFLLHGSYFLMHGSNSKFFSFMHYFFGENIYLYPVSHSTLVSPNRSCVYRLMSVTAHVIILNLYTEYKTLGKKTLLCPELNLVNFKDTAF